MTLALQEPSATADVVELADFLELKVLQAADGNASIADLLADLAIAATVEVLDIDPFAEDGLADPDEDEGLVDPGGELLEALGASATAEIEGREVACGGAYPFLMDEHGVLTVKPGALTSPYVFMLLLTRFGGKPKVGNQNLTTIDGTKVFEELAVVAAAEYFGWHDDHTLVYPFGFPRTTTPSGFQAAMNDLCQQTGEGVSCKQGNNLAHQQDGGLDIVVVRRFPDRRRGQMMGFGQCATGGNWRGKLTELQPQEFCDMWMVDPPPVTPLPMFMVPHTIEEDQWLHTTRYAGVLFDRCRMAYYSTHPDDQVLQRKITDWVAAVKTGKVDL